MLSPFKYADMYWKLVDEFERYRADTRESLSLSVKRYDGWTREYNKRKALEVELADFKTGNKVCFTMPFNRTTFSAHVAPRIAELEKENALLEGENRDLGGRILDLTRKLTEANDRFDNLKNARRYGYYV